MIKKSHCPKCGREILNENSFCPECGVPLRAAGRPNISRRSNSRRKSSYKTLKCNFCNGRGAFLTLSGYKDCTVCGGKGTVRILEPAEECINCNGTGVVRDAGGRQICPLCGGTGWVTKK